MKVRQELEGKTSKEWQDLPWETKYELTRNIPGNHDVFGVIGHEGVILGGGYVTLPSETKCYIVIQWHRDGDQENWNNWYWCDDISCEEARRLAKSWKRELKWEAKWAREEAEWAREKEAAQQ